MHGPTRLLLYGIFPGPPNRPMPVCSRAETGWLLRPVLIRGVFAVRLRQTSIEDSLQCVFDVSVRHMSTEELPAVLIYRKRA
ncbi:hypothetical protein Tam10B_1081 [Bifidobacterium vansinderenii]|uniref:Uncharacterized protein n=1 Tax=Bifidobacterium vansinderenii TaxID=1984871 RepID=A0A229VYL0_9BIFI|nr:hypothetical protein Tam10B_1081 [Bifidobacterium vansinderenii]